jgi:replicative DNA helicase
MSSVQSIAIPPHNLEAEKSVLGAVLLDERHLYALLIEEHLRPDHFYREQHGAVFAAMVELYENDRKIDHLTVAETLREQGKLEELGGPDVIDELAGWVPAAGHARDYARIVRDNAQMRALLTASYAIQASVLAREAPARDLVERAEQSMLEVAHDDRQKKIRSIADILHEETDKLHRLSVAKTALTGTPSGFKDLDEKTGGFQPGNLIVIAARPSMGKSALVANIAENAVLAGHAVALFSLEMSESELAQRFVASQARIKGEDLRRGRVPEHRWPKILEACQRLAQAPLYVDDSSDTGVLEVRAKARRLHNQVPDGLGLIIIDYLQLMRHEGRVESRVEQVGQISRGLKGLARELEVPVIALSQLSRAVEQRGGDKKPILSDLRECVTGETPVLMADGRRRPIRDLVGTMPEVLAVDQRQRVIRARSDAVWSVGRRPILELRMASGKKLRATAHHKVLSALGWRRLSQLAPGDRLALARQIPERVERGVAPRLRFLGSTRMVDPGWMSPESVSAETLSTEMLSAEALSTETLLTETVSAEMRSPEEVSAEMRSPEEVSAEMCSPEEVSAEEVSTKSGSRKVLIGSAPRATLVAAVASRPSSANGTQAPGHAPPLDRPELSLRIDSDLCWDRIVSIEDGGEEEVYDLTVPGPACWLADGLVTHNSGQIEQDSDLVMFIYREEYYDRDSDRPGEADIILAKHRNGPVGEIVLTFQREYPKFMNYASERFAA